MTYPLLPGAYRSLGFFQKAGVSNSSAEDVATLIGQAIPAGARGALVQATAQNMVWRDDGVAPTTAIGMVMLDGADPVWIDGAQLRAMTFIGAVAAGNLNFAFYG